MIKVILFILMFSIVSMLMVIYAFTSCTLSFQNVSTHGSAEDLIDDNLSTTPTVTTDIKPPVPGLPLRG